MTDSPPTRGLSTNRVTGSGARTRPLPRAQGAPRQLLLRLEQHAPRGVVVQDLRPLRGRPCGPILDPDAYLGALTNRQRTTRRKIHYQRRRLTGPTPSGMTCKERPRSRCPPQLEVRDPAKVRRSWPAARGRDWSAVTPTWSAWRSSPASPRSGTPRRRHHVATDLGASRPSTAAP